MMRLVSTLPIVLAACLVGCSWRPTHSELNRDDLFVTLEWCGAVTEPVLEVSFAGKENTAELEQWIAHNRRMRRGATLSKEDRTRLRALVEEERFGIYRSTIKPSEDKQQYVLTWRSSSEVSYFPLGNDASTIERLVRLKSVLNSAQAALVDSIITGIPTPNKSGGK